MSSRAGRVTRRIDAGSRYPSSAGGRRQNRYVAAATAILIGLSTLVLVSPGAATAQENPVEIRIGTILEPDDFNPFSMTTGISYTVLWITYEMLYTAGPDMGPYPQLAQSHSISEDGKVWTYYLSEDSYWHDDGAQVTAYDVEFTFNMILRNDKDCALLAGYLDNVTKVEAISDFVVQITTEEPKSTMLSINVPILPEDLWSAVEDAGKIRTVDMWDPNFFPDGPVGSGPLILDEYSKSGDFIRLLKWDKYKILDIENEGYIGPINVDEVLFKIYNFEGSMVTALETGLIDVAMGVPAVLWKAALDKPNIDGQSIQVLDMVDFGFNCAPEEYRTKTDDLGKDCFPKASTNYETVNLSLRKAVAMAINKTQILDEILQGYAEKGDSMVPTATPFWHYYVPEEEEYKFDIAAANELLNNSGYNKFDGSTFGFAGVRMNETSDVKLEFSFYYISTTYQDQLAAEKISNWLERLGIKAPEIGVPEGNLYTMWFGLEYDMFIWNWQPDPDPAFILSVLTTNEIPDDKNDITAWSDVYYSNAEYDKLYTDQLFEVNITKRQAIVHEMQRIAYRDCPYVILYYPYDLVAYRTDTFINYPDMTTYPAKAPDWIWFYFEVLPYGSIVNLPPTNVDAGPDQTADLGETLTFTGSADDPNTGDVLTWNWTFVEPDSTEVVLSGQTVAYTFDNLGEVTVTLKVTDSGGLSASDSLVVTVTEPIADAGWVRGYVKSEADAPIIGATVTAGDKTKATDTEGFYNMSLNPGTYYVNVSAQGYAGASEEVDVETGVVAWQNFTLAATSGSMVGNVYDVATGDPIGNAKIVLEQSGEEMYQKIADDEGYYEFPSITEGTYDVLVTAAGYEDDVTEVSVIAGETTTLDINMTAVKKEDLDISMAAIAAGAVVAAALVAIAALLLMKRRKKEGDLRSQPPGET